jgi:hypothetical protein
VKMAVQVAVVVSAARVVRAGRAGRDKEIAAEADPPPRNKTARLPYVDPSTEDARTPRHLQASDARWRAEKTEHSRMPLGRREQWAARHRQGATGPLAAPPPPPRPPQSVLRESGGDAPT